MALDVAGTNIREEALKRVSTLPGSTFSKKRKTKHTFRVTIDLTGEAELELMREEAANRRT